MRHVLHLLYNVLLLTPSETQNILHLFLILGFLFYFYFFYDTIMKCSLKTFQLKAKPMILFHFSTAILFLHVFLISIMEKKLFKIAIF
jgi:hypothetical protein